MPFPRYSVLYSRAYNIGRLLGKREIMQNYLRKHLDFSSLRYILWKLLLNHEGIVK